jgi:hypothetical protein
MALTARRTDRFRFGSVFCRSGLSALGHSSPSRLSRKPIFARPMHKLYDVYSIGWLSENWRACLELLPLGDSRWATYRGGYNRAPYNVVPLIRGLHREGT